MTYAELKATILFAEQNDGYLQLLSATERAPFQGKDWPAAELLNINEFKQSLWRYNAKALRLALERAERAAGTTVETSNLDSEPTGPVDTSFPYGWNKAQV